MMGTKVRFAPSPTGFLHVGGLRTALFNYLYAKKVVGKILLRIEDTDQKRKNEKSIQNLFDTFKKLNIQFDEGPKNDQGNGPYFQSKRLNIYKKHIQMLIDKKYAYPCFCTPARLEKLRKKQIKQKQTIKYDRYCHALDNNKVAEKIKNEPYVIRMKIPMNGEVVFFDLVRDKVIFKLEEIDDQVLIKSDGYPTYHFANVVDDHLMGITHVMRGEEWLPSTPKHVLLYQFFNWKLPKFIHLPLLLNADKSKLSKRQGDVAVDDYLKNGIIPDALINFVALLGWHPKHTKEIFSLTELEKEFSIKRIQKSASVFDVEKLEWMNSQYLMNMSLIELAKLAKPFFSIMEIDISDNKKYLLVIDCIRKRVKTLSEMPIESKRYYDDLKIAQSNIDLLNTSISQKLLQTVFITLNKKNNLDGNDFKSIVTDIGKKLNIVGKNLFSPVRIAIYGDSIGPDLPIIYSILGKKETLNRLAKVIKW